MSEMRSKWVESRLLSTQREGVKIKIKTAQEIAADCGLNEIQVQFLERSLSEQGSNCNGHDEVIGALYRRIEKLEEANTELLEALRWVVGDDDSGEPSIVYARAAIANAEGRGNENMDC